MAEQYADLRRAIAARLGGWCPEIGSHLPLEAAIGDTYLTVEGKLFIWDGQWREITC